MHLEIQVSTQLAEVITSLTHGIYEQGRNTRPVSFDGEWKWDADLRIFKPAYLGHGLCPYQERRSKLLSSQFLNEEAAKHLVAGNAADFIKCRAALMHRRAHELVQKGT